MKGRKELRKGIKGRNKGKGGRKGRKEGRIQDFLHARIMAEWIFYETLLSIGCMAYSPWDTCHIPPGLIILILPLVKSPPWHMNPGMTR